MPDNPNVGPKPVEAEPNQYREKTYQPPNPPKEAEKATKGLPEGTTREKTADEMDEATREVKKRL